MQMNETMSYLLDGELDLAALEQAANLLLDRHELLRCAFKQLETETAMEYEPNAVLRITHIKVGGPAKGCIADICLGCCHAAHLLMPKVVCCSGRG